VVYAMTAGLYGMVGRSRRRYMLLSGRREGIYSDRRWLGPWCRYTAWLHVLLEGVIACRLPGIFTSFAVGMIAAGRWTCWPRSGSSGDVEESEWLEGEAQLGG
jgi:hypothetical protein